MDRGKILKLASLPRLEEDLINTERLIDETLGQRPDIYKALAVRARQPKRLRPIFLLVCARLAGRAAVPKAIKAAAALELIHESSLAHDDAIDEPAADIARLLLSGDYLLACGFKLAAAANTDTAGTLAEAVADMVQGQMLQAKVRYSQGPHDPIYNKVNAQKTGALFGTACQLGGHLCGLPPKSAHELYFFGSAFGSAYQIKDDIKDGDVPKKLEKAYADSANNFLENAEQCLDNFKASQAKTALLNICRASL